MVYMMMSTRNFTYCHDPYAFAAYANAQGYGSLLVNIEEETKPEDDQLSASTSSASIEVTSDTTDEEIMPKPRPVIVGPCGHTEIRRLRFKKGLSHYLCTCCGTKWKQGHN